MRLDGVSGRRLATLVLLVLASALCVALVAARISRTGTLEYRFLVWNLFLAWLPFVFALALYAVAQPGLALEPRRPRR